MSLVYLDTETTGLELHHDIWEIAWAVDDGPIESRFMTHSLRNADPEALELNGYWHRIDQAVSCERVDHTLRAILDGVTIVGANPAFDAIRLQLRWQAQPWHYRMIDISSMAVGVFGTLAFVTKEITTIEGKKVEIQVPPGLFGVRELLIDFYGDSAESESIPEPDHTAAGDVATLRQCYMLLQRVRF